MKHERLTKISPNVNENDNLVQIDLMKYRVNNNLTEFDASVSNIIMEAIIEYKPRNACEL